LTGASRGGKEVTISDFFYRSKLAKFRCPKRACQSFVYETTFESTTTFAKFYTHLSYKVSLYNPRHKMPDATISSSPKLRSCTVHLLSTNLTTRTSLASADTDKRFFFIPGTYNASTSVKELPFTPTAEQQHSTAEAGSNKYNLSNSLDRIRGIVGTGDYIPMRDKLKRGKQITM